MHGPSLFANASVARSVSIVLDIGSREGLNARAGVIPGFGASLEANAIIKTI